MRLDKLLFPLILALSGSVAIAATVTISPSGGDDTAALQKALGIAQTVQVTGTLKISSTVTPANGSGIGGGAIQWTGAAGGYAITFSGNVFADTGTTFAGAGMNLTNATAPTITGCTFQNIAGTGNIIYFANGITGATITGNKFLNSPGAWGIVGFNAANSHFDGNTFKSIYEGVHIIWGGGSGNSTVNFNDVSAFTRHGIELQGYVKGLQVEHNYVHDPTAAASHIWLSIATGGNSGSPALTTGVIIAGNVLTAPAGFVANPQVNYCGIEAMGSGTQVTGNYEAGLGWGGLYADDSALVWTNNQYHMVGAGVPCTGEGSSAPLATIAPTNQAGNTSDNAWPGTVPAAILATVGPAAMTGPPAPPTPAPATQPAITLTDNGDGSITVKAPAAFTSLTVAGSAPADTATLAVPSTLTAKIGGIPNGWTVFVTVPGYPLSQVVAHGGGATFAPAVLSPTATTAPPVTPATQPYLTHDVKTRSDGKISVDGGAFQ